VPFDAVVVVVVVVPDTPSSFPDNDRYNSARIKRISNTRQADTASLC
jgi:hypothetical protein